MFRGFEESLNYKLYFFEGIAALPNETGKDSVPHGKESSLIGITLADYSSTGCSPAEPVSASSAVQRYVIISIQRQNS